MEIIFHEEYLEHRHNGIHPERPERLESIMSALDDPDILIPCPATEDMLTRIHSAGYLEKMKTSGCGYIDGGDTYLGENTYEIALRAAGGAVLGALTSMNNNTSTMALLRPPGHHSGRNYGGGFCYLNNMAIAVAATGSKRTAIIDIDGHHGNGTSDIFYSDPGVLFISAHHYGIYPGTGESIAIGDGAGAGYNVNIPFPAGAGDSSYEFAWDELIVPVITEYDPEIILVSLGTDGHYADAMTGLSLSSQAYVDMAKKAMGLSKRLCNGRISFLLEGGYHTGSLAEIIRGITMSDTDHEMEFTDVHDTDCIGRRSVMNTKTALRDNWDL